MAAPAAPNDGNDEHAWLSRGHAPFAGKYAVERVLGQGGMGIVLAARHIRLGQRVAIKVLGSGLREHPELVARFEREARAAGSLTSAHVVRVFDIDVTEDGTPFIVMELLAGRDLAAIIDVEGPQPVARAVRWLVQACDAISEAHRLGIIHRDLKPSNLFLAEEGGRSIVKVLDFGIAKRVSTGEASITHAVAPMGTPHYMSPEQVRCTRDVDARTDVWSLGVTLYELLCGSPPFPHESSAACIAAIAADPVPDPRTLRPELGAEVAAVLMTALAKKADDRYQSVADLVAALVPLVAGELDPCTELPLSVPVPSPSSIPIVLDLPPVPESPAVLGVSPRTSRARHGARIPRIGRARSGLALASAAALGFLALIVTPKCVSTGNDANGASGARTANGDATRNAPEVVALPGTAVSAPVSSAPLSALPPSPSLAIPTPLAVAQPIPPSRPSLVPAAVSTEKRALRTPGRAAPALPSAATRGGAHGGLSSPGF